MSLLEFISMPHTIWVILLGWLAFFGLLWLYYCDRELFPNTTRPWVKAAIVSTLMMVLSIIMAYSVIYRV